MTKLIQQLSFSSSNYFEAAAIEPHPNVKPKNFSESVSLNEAGSKRSAISASDAECFSLCLGAGPLWLIFICTSLPGGPDVPAQNSAPPGGVNSGASSPATPSTPTHDDNCDLLSGLLCSASITDSSESLPAAATNAASRQDLLNDQAREQVISKILERKSRRPVKVDFKIYLTENTSTHWEAVVQGPTLYLRIPGVLSAGSKDSFVTLLDFVEERLNCTNCIVCIRKNRPDRAALIRTFMFLGFQLLPPASPLLPTDLANPDYMFLHYNMN